MLPKKINRKSESGGKEQNDNQELIDAEFLNTPSSFLVAQSLLVRRKSAEKLLAREGIILFVRFLRGQCHRKEKREGGCFFSIAFPPVYAYGCGFPQQCFDDMRPGRYTKIYGRNSCEKIQMRQVRQGKNRSRGHYDLGRHDLLLQRLLRQGQKERGAGRRVRILLIHKS